MAARHGVSSLRSVLLRANHMSPKLLPTQRILLRDQCQQRCIQASRDCMVAANGIQANRDSERETSGASLLECTSPTSAVGRVDMIIGPMFSGKTTELIKRVVALEAKGVKVATIKSDKDDRYKKTFVVTHDGVEKACFATPSLTKLREQLGEQYSAVEAFAIDEAQFFPDLVEFCMAAADKHNKHIILAGLDGDFLRRNFGQVGEMVPKADTVTKLNGQCAYCKRASLFSLRIAADNRVEVVGGADKYAPVCRDHYNKMSEIRELEPAGV